MHNIIKNFLLVFLLCSLITGCSTLSDFYSEWIPSENIPAESRLQEGEEPRIYYSTDIYSDAYFLQSNYNWIIGNAAYNGPSEESIQAEIADMCKKNGAKIAVYTSEYTGTRSGITGYGDYISTYSIDRYDYNIFFFVPMTIDETLYFARIGLSCRDMDAAERLAVRQNTGAYVHLVYADSPAYYANLFPGDVIVRINGEEVLDSDSFYALISSITSETPLEITYIRDGQENTVTILPLY